jgi:hypothetical protein
MKGVHGRVVAFAAICSLASGCVGSRTSSMAPVSPRAGFDAPQASREAAMRTEVETKLRTGYHYQITGHFQSIDVAIGKPPVFHLWPGGHGDIALVRAPAPKFRLVPAVGDGRTASGFTDPPDCVDCGGVDGKSTPSPGPTPPPNYGPCSSSGGATRYNDATGAGGCTQPGNSTPLSCGSWTWSSRGRGTLIVPGTGTIPDLDYVVDDGHGGCRLGTVSS